MGKKRSAYDRWLEKKFKSEGVFEDTIGLELAISTRFQELEANLPDHLRQIRRLVRKKFLIPEDGPAIVLGEQSVGLLEPSVVLGKRLVAAIFRNKFSVVDYRAQTDVAGSEPGLNRVVLPNPYTEIGAKSVSIVPERLRRLSTTNIYSTDINFERLEGELSKIYWSSKNPRVQEFLELMRSSQKKNPTFAGLQDCLFYHFVHGELGVPVPSHTISDFYFDTFVFLNGGYDWMKENWFDVVNLSREVQGKLDVQYCRVPEVTEAPFFVILNQPGAPRGVLYHDGEFSNFTLQLGRKTEFTFSEKDLLNALLNRKCFISLRAIPRAWFLACIFDGHISGGGALYNIVVKPPFERLTKCSYWPIGFLLPYDKEGNGIVQYKSAALRKTTAPYLEQAQEAVRRNTVSLLDLFLSINPELAAQEVASFISCYNNIGLPFDARLKLPEECYIHR